MTNDLTEIKNLIPKVIANFGFLYVILGAFIFLPPMTFDYWQGWLYIATFATMMFFFMIYLIKNDRELLQRRMEKGETREKQKFIIRIANLTLIGFYIIPGFDRRYGWSDVPLWLVIAADIGFILGYLLFFFVLKENSYASRLVKVEVDKQQVITTGPYRFVRHPMYTSVSIMMFFTPLVLGSYWGLITFIPLLFILYARISDEEDLLVDELDGYKEYREKTRYKVIPLIW